MVEKPNLRKEVIEYVKSYYARTKSVPSIRRIVIKFTPSLNRGNFYVLFPSGLKEVCREANARALLLKASY